MDTKIAFIYFVGLVFFFIVYFFVLKTIHPALHTLPNFWTNFLVAFGILLFNFGFSFAHFEDADKFLSIR